MSLRLLAMLLGLTLWVWMSACYPDAPADDDDSAGDDDDSAGDDDDSAGDDDDTPADHGLELWFRVECNLHLAESCQSAMDVMSRAAQSGYTGVHFVAFKDHLLRDGDSIPADDTNLAAVLAHAESLGLEVMKEFAFSGVGEGLLRADPHLAEGIPTQANFKANINNLVLDPDFTGTPSLPNGDFESWNGDQLDDWAWTDAGIYRESSGGFNDQYAMRVSLEQAALTVGRQARAGVSLSVREFTQYHVRFWARTDNAVGSDGQPALNGARFGVHIKDDAPGHPWRIFMAAEDLPIAATQGWTQYDFTFNSMEDREPEEGDGGKEIIVYVGAWDVPEGATGSLWIDNVEFEEAALVNLVDRVGTPVAVSALNSVGSMYSLTPGDDYNQIIDPDTGTAGGQPGVYDRWHPPPVLTLPASTSLQHGQKVRVFGYTVERVYSGSVAPSMCDEGVFDILELHLAMLREKYPATRSFLLSYDEIRQANWGADCDKLGFGPGVLLAWHTARTTLMLNDGSFDVNIYAWSDMYDPNHNALLSDFPVNGSFAGSWVGLDSDTVIINWNDSVPSLQHFEQLGLRQLISGNGDNIASRLANAVGIGGVVGAHYVNWYGAPDYPDLEAFAEAVLAARAAGAFGDP